MTLLVDAREPKHVIQELSDVPGMRVEMLAYGDFMIVGSDKQYVIERKAISDLFASAQDNRLWEQLKGMEKFEGFHRVLLIEGQLKDASAWNKSITPARFSGIKTSVLFGWHSTSVIQTETQGETIDLIKRLTAKVGDGGEGYIPRALGITKDKRTPNEELVDVLRGFDGVDEVGAQAMLVKFKTVGHAARASLRELYGVLNRGDAEHVFEGFRRPFVVPKKPKAKPNKVATVSPVAPEVVDEATEQGQ